MIISKKILVVGSGLSSYFFLKPLKKNIRKDVVVLTGATNHVRNDLKYNLKEISLTRSNHFKGLSKDWLGSSSKFEIKDSKIKLLNELISIQKHFLDKKIINTRNLDIRNIPENFKKLLFYKSKKIKFTEAINLKNKSDEKALTSKISNDVEYKDFRLIKINKRGDNYICHCVNKKNKKIIINSEYIIFASGTIDTALFLIDLLKINKISFRHQPYFYGFFITRNKHKNYKNFDYPIINYQNKYKNIEISGSLGTLSERVLKHTKLNILNYEIFKPIKKVLFNNFVFFNCFINSKINFLSIKKDKDNFFLSSKLEKKDLHKLIKKISINFFNKLNFVLNNKIIFKKILLPKIGFDKHYFGVKLKNFVNKSSKLKKHNKIYIVDQSVLGFDTHKFVTFLSICNSYRIGKLLNKKLGNSS